VTEASTRPQTETAQVDAAAPSSPEVIPVSSIVGLEPVGTAVCVVEPEVNRVCVYHRAVDGITAHGCYTFAARVREWPRWLVGGEPTTQRIQLMDEAGNASLQVVAEGAWADGDMAQLPRPDFDALVSKVMPWRTVWVVSQQQMAPAQAADVAAVRDVLERWRQAWEGRRFDEYAGYYSASFVPQVEQDPARWRRYKQRLFERSGPISVQVAAPSIFVIDKGATALITFEQSYRSKTFTSYARKAMRWRRDGERWTISAEAVLHEVAGPTGSTPLAH
jgi:ketosteroid isomerase-like protein